MGMPFQDDMQPVGVIALSVRIIFTLIEVFVRFALLPIMAISRYAGAAFAWLFRLPFRMLGVAAQLVGLVVVIALILLVVVAVFTLVAA